MIVVDTGQVGASAAATLGELGYSVLSFCIKDSPRRAHSIAARASGARRPIVRRRTMAQTKQQQETGSILGYQAKFVDVDGIRTRYYEAGEENSEVWC